MDNKVKPAVIGGVVLGLLSAIPFVNFVNACCCLWAILGGLLASYLYVKNSPTPVNAGDGAIVGAIAGVVGGLISLIRRCRAFSSVWWKTRSEEHTSELQSPCNLVCSLLLEKKNS